MTEARNRVCLSLCVSHARELETALRTAESQADFVEVRLDCLAEGELERVLQKPFSSAKPIIFTLRPEHHGGRRVLELAERIKFAIGVSKESWVDLELDLVEVLMADEIHRHAINWQRVICSHHDFDGVGNPEEIYQRLARTPARVLKFAFMAHDVSDNLVAFRLLDKASSDSRELVALCMGEAGTVSRILGPTRGAFFTYAAASSGEETAPGQLTVDQLRDLYRFDHISRETKVMGVVGWPISHSLSPNIHNAAFAASETDAVFLPFAVKNLDDFIERMVRPGRRELDWNLRGLSVTAPHKATMLNHLDWIEPAAKEIGAVNTVVLDGDRLLGYNTDATAFLVTLREAFGEVAGSRVAVIGSGGAARAVTHALRANAAEVTIVARDQAKRSELAGEFECAEQDLSRTSFADFDIVVNTTPLGTVGVFQDESPASRNQLRGARLVYDLVYNPAETKLLREAKAAGCQTAGGLEMLISQAAAQFRLWTGSDAPVSVMKEAARKSLLADGTGTQSSIYD